MKGLATNLVRHEEVMVFQSITDPNQKSVELRVTYREPIIVSPQQIDTDEEK